MQENELALGASRTHTHTALPRLAGSARVADALPRMQTAPRTAPGTPASLSHYIDFSPAIARLTKRRGTRKMGSERQEELERIRLETEAQERQEADFWGYGRKVRPGSRMGLDGRKIPSLPPWSQSPEVTFALTQMERRVPVDQLGRSGILDKLGDTRFDSRSLRSNNYGRVAPYALTRHAPLLAGFTSDDIPVPNGKSEKGIITICEFSQAEGLLPDVLHARGCDVLMGNQIPIYPEKFGPLLPRLRLCVLAGNQIGDRTESLIPGLQAATELTHLTIAENRIGDEGAANIASAISNTTLVNLCLRNNLISNDGAAAISCTLQRCSCFELMYRAVDEGQAAVVEAVLAHGFPVNPIYPGEEHLLLKAARAGSASICESLLDLGADIEAKDGQGDTAVMLAAANGHKRVLTLLLDRGAEMNVRDRDGRSALMLASRNGHVECLQVLIGVARLLPQRVTIVVRGIRDLDLQPNDVQRAPSAASGSSNDSAPSQWSKVRSVKSLLGSFGRKASASKATAGDQSAGSSTPKSGGWGPGLLRRMSGSISRSLSFTDSQTSIGDKRQEEDEGERRNDQTNDAEVAFGRLPSTNSGVSGTSFGTGIVQHVSGVLSHDQTWTTSGMQFGQVEASRPPSRGMIARLPSVSEHREEVQENGEQASAHATLPQASRQPASGDAPTGLGLTAKSAMAKAPSLMKRPSVAIWAADMSKLEDTKKPSAATETGGAHVPVLNAATRMSFLRRPSFGKPARTESLSRSASAQQGHDTVCIRLSIGRLASRKEVLTPVQEVPRSSAAVEMEFQHDFADVSCHGGLNSRFKVELLWSDPQQPSAGFKSAAVCVEDIDDVILGKKEAIDGWFVLHDFNTRRRVCTARCVIRSMPQQFNDTCFSGDNVLIHACRLGQTDCVRLILNAGISTTFKTKEGNTPLHVAAQGGHRSTVELLLRHGADMSATNKGGLTPMDIAEKFDQLVVCMLLRGVIQQREQMPMELEAWPADVIDAKDDPLAFLKENYRGQYSGSRLVVEVVGARHLPKADVTGLADPYITLNLNGMKYTSKVVKRSLEPVWAETFVFDDQSQGVWEGQHVTFQVFDWDLLGESDLLGSFRVDISSMAKLQPPQITRDEAEMGRAWFPLRTEEGRIVQGQHDPAKLADGRLEDSEVCIRFRFTPAVGRYVQIGIMEARNVPGITGKANTLPSAFATVSMGEGSYRTDPVKRNANPSWQTSYRFSAKTMDAWLTLELHELQLARTKGAGAIKTKLEPSVESMIGQVRVPLHKLFSISNANLKDIWVQLKDRDGLLLKDAIGQVAAVRLILNFVVLGETIATWSESSLNSLVIERNTKLDRQVVDALKPFIQEADFAADAIDEFERLMSASDDRISVDGMAEAARTLKVDMSQDLIMLRMLINAEHGEHVVDFNEFCRVLHILQGEKEQDGEGDQVQDGDGDQDLQHAQNPDSTKSGEISDGPSEKLVRKHIDPAVGMRVKLSRDAVDRFPHLLEESGWTLKEGPAAVMPLPCPDVFAFAASARALF